MSIIHLSGYRPFRIPSDNVEFTSKSPETYKTIIPPHGKCLCSRILEVGNKVLSFLVLLDTGEHHLGAGDVLLRVLKVREQGVLVPRNALVDVGGRVGVAIGLASLAAEQTVEVGSLLVCTALIDSVACVAMRIIMM